MNSMPVFSRLLESTSSSMANTSGSTRTTAMTSACWEHADYFPDRVAQLQNPRVMQSRATYRTTHGFTAYVVMSQRRGPFLYAANRRSRRRARRRDRSVFRIDHDENFNQTTHLQYQP